MQLDEFFDYKERLMGDLLTSPEIVALIGEDIDPSHPEQLMYTRVFPYEYVPETVDDGYTFICCDVDIQRVASKTYYDPVLYIWVFTHRSRLRLPEGGVRPDKICAEICKKINGSRMYGLGELNLYSVRRFAPMTDYQGKVITFDAKDFNRLHDAKQYIPANRKEGLR